MLGTGAPTELKCVKGRRNKKGPKKTMDKGKKAT
jgi:hypothetical protein